jgi:hypothetical protein
MKCPYQDIGCWYIDDVNHSKDSDMIFKRDITFDDPTNEVRGKKVIGLLEQTEGCIMLAHAEASPIDRKELNRAINYINDAMAEIKQEAGK